MLEPTYSTLFAAPMTRSPAQTGHWRRTLWILWPRWLLQEKKKGSLSVASNCSYHYAAMNYKAAAKFSKADPCTNVPVHCPLCPTSVSGQPQTMWKYNAMYHLIQEHSMGDTSLPIPRQLLIQIFIPYSDGFETYLQGPLQVDERNRSDTVSTANSDKHDGKRHKLGYIQEWITFLCGEIMNSMIFLLISNRLWHKSMWQHSHFPQGGRLISPRTPMHAPWVWAWVCFTPFEFKNLRKF